MDRLLYHLKRPQYSDLDKEIVKIILIKGMRDEYINTLNLLGKGDITREPYDEVVQLCQRCCRGSARNHTTTSNPSANVLKTTNSGETRAEIGNLLEKIRTEIISLMYSQLHMMQVK